MLKLIWAQDIKNGIAKNGQIPWNIKEEMFFFKKTTLNNIVVMGYSTWKTLKVHPLKNRLNYVFTNSHKNEINYPNTFCVNNIDDILSLKNKYFEKDIYIIGGKSVYDLFFPYADQIIMSVINKDYECDLFLNYNLANFLLYKVIEYPEFKVFIYNKIAYKRD